VGLTGAWYWDDQDGGDGGEGVVIEDPDEDGWSMIFWELTGIENRFHNGAEGIADVMPVTPKPKPAVPTPTPAAPKAAADNLPPKQLTLEQCRHLYLNGPEKEHKKLGDYKEGEVIQVLQEYENPRGTRCYKTNTATQGPGGHDVGGPN